MSRHWLSRLMVAAWAGNLGAWPLIASDSRSANAVQSAGGIGLVFVGALVAMSVLAFVDVVVNDLMPERYQLRLKHYRHIGFMAIAISLVLLGGAISTKAGSALVFPSFLLPALFAVAVTWLDMFARHGIRQ